MLQTEIFKNEQGENAIYIGFLPKEEIMKDFDERRAEAYKRTESLAMTLEETRKVDKELAEIWLAEMAKQNGASL